MIGSLKEKINAKIKENQIKKQELYEQISNIDNELLELNETMLKMNDNNSFLDISPNEAFKILDKLGYNNKAERLDSYLEIIKSLELERDKNLVVERNNEDSY